MSAPLDELRSALWATLALPESTAAPAYFPLAKRVSVALQAIGSEAPDAAFVGLMEDLAREYRAHAVAVGRPRFADSPLFPYGIVGYVDAFCSDQRFRELRGGHADACLCALALEHGMLDHLDPTGFVKTAERGDAYDRHIDYRCPRCERGWRHHDRSTEQYTAWAWEPIDRRHG